MKVLVFHIGPDRYGIPLRVVQRVLPLMALKRLPLAPPAVAGLMNLHGQPVPVIDLARLAGASASAEHVDTRIVVADYHSPEGQVHALGLLAERVQNVQEIDESDLVDSGVTAAPFLGTVAGDGAAPGSGAGIVQLVELQRLLPADLRAALFQPSASLEGAAP